MITMICGVPGAGKSSYMAYLAVQSMLDGGTNYRACKRELLQLNESGTQYAPPPQHHCVYSDNSVHFGRRLRTYWLDGFTIGLANPFFASTFLPPYSAVFLDEAQRYYDSRMSRYLRDEVYHWYQFHRHMDYSVYLACQRPANIDVNIRALAERVIVLEQCKTTENDYGQVCKVVWLGREFASADSAESYLLNSDKCDTGKEFRAECDFDIFSCYNSKSCRPAFYADNYYTKIDYYTEQGYEFTLSSFVEYNANHYFTAPQGYWKNPTRDKELLTQKGAYNGD